MAGYLVRRLLLLIPMTLGITLITFLIVRMAGAGGDEQGDPTQGGRSTERGGSPRENMMAEEFGAIDSSLASQYLHWLGHAARGDFGESLNDGLPVAAKIARALPITLVFNLLAVIVIYLLAVPAGVYAAMHPGKRFDTFSSLLLYILFSMPSFWVAILLIRYVGSTVSGLGWLPYNSVYPDGWRNMTTLQFFWYALPYMVLPLVSMSYNGMAGLSRYARVGMIEVVRMDYIRTARAKGLSEAAVMIRHAFPNSVIPLVTLLGDLLPGMIGGSVIIEAIFSIPGMGKLGYDAVVQKDYTVLMAVTTLSAILTMLGILLSDLLYAAVDPRIGFDAEGTR
ncbi:MAG: ABC transporter permease [Planctomycetota bacterium]